MEIAGQKSHTNTKFFAYLAPFLLIMQSLGGAYENREALLEEMVAHSEPRHFLLSYPRSGNTWIRYIIEFLTRRPTAQYQSPKNQPMNMPLGFLEDFKIDISKNPVWKAHFPYQLDIGKRNYDKNNDILVFIIRNPKECIIREIGRLLTKDDIAYTNLVHWYFKILKLYDDWDPQKRLLLHYEDLLTNPREIALKILDFLNEPYTYMEEFFSHYDFHKERALHIYSKYEESKSNGSDVLFHSKTMDPRYRMQVDSWIAEKYPKLWNRYLKDFYSEEKVCGEVCS